MSESFKRHLGRFKINHEIKKRSMYHINRSIQFERLENYLHIF